MVTKDYKLDEENITLFEEVLKKAMWLDLNGGVGDNMPLSISLLDTTQIISRFNADALTYRDHMMQILDDEYEIKSRLRVAEMPDVPEIALDMYEFLLGMKVWGTESQVQFDEAARHHMESSVSSGPESKTFYSGGAMGEMPDEIIM